MEGTLKVIAIVLLDIAVIVLLSFTFTWLAASGGKKKKERKKHPQISKEVVE